MPAGPPPLNFSQAQVSTKITKAKSWTWLLWVVSVLTILILVAQNMSDGANFVVLYLFLSVIGIFLFMIPSLIGFRRDVQSKWLLFFANVVLGATGVVWIACLVYACFGPKMETLSVNKNPDRSPIDGSDLVGIENLFELHKRKT